MSGKRGTSTTSGGRRDVSGLADGPRVHPFEALRATPAWPALADRTLLRDLIPALSASDGLLGALFLSEVVAQFGVEAGRVKVLYDRTLADLARIWRPERASPAFDASRARSLSDALERMASPAAATPAPAPRETSVSIAVFEAVTPRTEREHIAANQARARVGECHAGLLERRILACDQAAYAELLPSLVELRTRWSDSRISEGFTPVAARTSYPGLRALTPSRRGGPPEIKALIERAASISVEGARFVDSLPQTPPSWLGPRATALYARWRSILIRPFVTEVGLLSPGAELRDVAVLAADEGEGRVRVSVRHPLGCLESAECFEALTEFDDARAPLPATACTERRDAHYRVGCETQDVAMALILRALADGTEDGRVIAAMIDTPSHELLLRGLRRAVETPGDARKPPEPDAEPAWLVDALIDPAVPVWVRPKRRGEGYVLARAAPPTPTDWATFAPADADPILLHFQRSRPSAVAYGHSGPPLHAILHPLIGKKRVFYKHVGRILPLRVLPANPHVAFDVDADGLLRPSVRIAPGATPTVPYRYRLPEPGDTLHLLDISPDETHATLWVGAWTAAATRVCGPILGALGGLEKQEDGFAVPAEAREAVVDAALRLAVDGPVALDEAWLGEGEDAPLRLVVQLGFAPRDEGRALSVRFRVFPSDNLGPLAPAEGPQLLPHTRDGVVGHLRRDFEAEVDAAGGLIDDLVAGGLLRDDPGAAWEHEVEDADTAMALILRLETLRGTGWNGAPLSLAWDAKPPRVARGVSMEDLKLRLREKPKRDWLSLEGGFQIDGSELPLRELLMALNDGKRFVEMKGDVFVEISDAIRAKLQPLMAFARPTGNDLAVSPLALHLAGALEEAGVEVDAPPEWRLRRDRLKTAMATDYPLPAGLKAELRPYQREGVQWLRRLAEWSTGAVLADDMGLGKTVQAIALLLARASEGPALVLAPTSVVPNWRRELARFAPGLDVRIAQSGAQLGADHPAGEADVLVTSHDVFSRNDDALTGPRWGTVVIDEAHAIKNSHTRRATAARKLDAGFVIALTGTPVENRPRELWSLMRVVAPGLLGDERSFQSTYGRAIEVDKDDVAAAALAEIVRPFILRRTKAQVATDLPPREEVRVDVVFGEQERARYERVRKAAMAEIDRIRRESRTGRDGLSAVEMLKVLMRLRQLACHGHLVEPAKVPPTREAGAKVDRLVGLVEDLLAEGKQILVFSQFTEFLAIVARALTEAGVQFQQLDGSTPATKRPVLIDAFQRGDVPVFLLSLKAGGVGLNLTAASEVILLDPWWNPAVEDQAADRAHRIGQARHVTVYRLISEGTVEEQILALHAEKRQMVSSLLDGTASTAAIGAEEIERVLMSAVL